MLGAAIAAGGYALNVVLMTEIRQLVLVTCLIGAGVGLAYDSIPSSPWGSVPTSETAAANKSQHSYTLLATPLQRGLGSRLGPADHHVYGRPTSPRVTFEPRSGPFPGQPAIPCSDPGYFRWSN
jgi:hypothetical protein